MMSKPLHAFYYLLALLLASQLGASGRSPNIVFILADDLGYTDLSLNGNPYHETPHIDALAARGMRFNQAYSAAPLCSATRAAILSGWAPARQHLHAVTPLGKDNGNSRNYADWKEPPVYKGGKNSPYKLPMQLGQFPAERETIAERLSAAGYATCFIGKWHLGTDKSLYPHAHGFETVMGVNDLAWPRSYLPPFQLKDLDNRDEDTYLSQRLMDEGISFIESHRNQPFFLYMSMYAVHGPWQGHPDDLPYFQDKLKKSGFNGNPDYASMIKRMDMAVGELLNALQRMGLTDNTLIIFTSDNGGINMTKKKDEVLRISDMSPFRGAKSLIREGGVRVPFIVYWPGKVQAGCASEALLNSTDIYPTLLEVAGLEQNTGYPLDGYSLMDIFHGGKNARRHVTFHMPHDIKADEEMAPCSAIRSGKWKLYQFHGTNRIELYDLDSDISESANVADRHPEILQNLTRELQMELQAQNAHFAQLNK